MVYMRKFVKDKLLKLIETLEEMNRLLEKIIVKNDIQHLTEFLSEEQQAAIAIGEKIENAVEFQDREAVSLLEAYCEELWNMSQKRKRKELEHCRIQLQKRLREIRISIQKCSEQYQVLFLPYKASMWDCMESVWKAAKKDPECVCCVVPIPYYDLLPDGTFGEIHYEADLLPKYVPVISFDQYQLEEEQPEIIYIHNPYDNMNRVTSVDPAYYSHILKQYTDKLVYIPYFSTRGNMPLSHRLLPVYYHADIIVLQNECMLEDIDSSIAREKLLVLGSPKEERMVWMELHKEEMDMPDDWKRQLTGRTVFFLNTSITSILKEEEKRLNKIEEVFDVIAGRKDTVLIWRPHPLIEATLKAMRPDLEKKYNGLKRRFQKEKIGILDMTADVERAVALSDAYIGESSSSVIELFHVVHKPRIFLGTQNFYQPALDELRSESVWDICDADGGWWFVSEKLQLLCRFNIETGKTDVVAAVPEIPVGAGPHYVGSVCFEQQIILVPWRADAICIYNIADGGFAKFYFQDEYAYYCFGTAIMYGTDLFLVPGDYPGIVRFNMKSKQFFYYKKCIEEVCEITGNKEQGVRFTKWNINQYGEKIHLVPCETNIILIFNMRTFDYQVVRVGNDVNYVAMISDEHYDWLLTEEPRIVRWEKQTGARQEYNLCLEETVPGQIPFLDVLDFGDRLYLFPYHAKQIRVFYKETGKFDYTDFKLPYQEDEYESEYYQTLGTRYKFVKKISDHEIIAFSNYNRSFVLIDIERQVCKLFPLRIDNYNYWELRRKPNYPLEVREDKDNILAKCVDRVVDGYPVPYYRKGERKLEIVSEVKIGQEIHMKVKSFKTMR